MSGKQFLIRIHSISNDGNFDALFSEEIIVKPNSHIALKSLHFLRGEGDFVIDATNNAITFQIEEVNVDGYGGEHTILLESETYTRENISLLLQDISDKINATLDIRSKQEFGTQVKMYLNTDSKIHYEAKRNGLAMFGTRYANNEFNPYLNDNGLTITEHIDNFWFSFTSTFLPTAPHLSAESYNKNFMWYSLPITKGCGVARLIVQKFVNINYGAPAGIVLGLMEKTKEDKLLDKTWDITDLDYYVRTGTSNQQNSAYLSKPNNDVDNQTLPKNFQDSVNIEDVYNNNDKMEIKISDGKITSTIHQNFGDFGWGSTEIGSSAYPYDKTDINEKEYYVVVSVLGDDTTTKVLNIEGNTDPYNGGDTIKDKQELSNYKLNDPIPGGLVDPNPHDTKSIFNLIFGKSVLANSFGFDSLSQNKFLTATTQANYIAERSLSKFLQTDTFLFELLNLSVVSYDSYNERYLKSPGAMLGGRRNIIATNIAGEDGLESERVYYQPNELMFISLDNKNTLSLRSIKARIVSTDYSTIQVDDMCEATLVIKEN